MTVTKRDWRPSAMAWTRRDTRPEAWRDERRYGRLVLSDRELECALATLIRGRTLAVGARRVWARARTNVDPPVVKALWTKADIVLDWRVSGACEVRGKADSVRVFVTILAGIPSSYGQTVISRCCTGDSQKTSVCEPKLQFPSFGEFASRYRAPRRERVNMRAATRRPSVAIARSIRLHDRRIRRRIPRDPRTARDLPIPRPSSTTLRGAHSSNGDAPRVVVDVLPDVPRHGKGGCFVDHCDARVAPTDPNGPLAGLTFAVKDNLDVAHHRTGCGQPTWLDTHPHPAKKHAPPVASLLAAGATLVGKTQMDELAWALQGENHHYGTPVNPTSPGSIPGGSSSGSAVAVAAGYADVALGTDTAGSVRVPAAYCGICGFRPTHGRVDATNGCVPLAPSFDTIGWFARDATTLLRCGGALLPPWGGWDTKFDLKFDGLLAEDAFALCDEATERRLRECVGRVCGAGALGGGPKTVVLGGVHGTPPLTEWWNVFRVIQANEVWREHGAWVTEHDPRFGPGVKERFEGACAVTDAEASEACTIRDDIAARLEAVTVDEDTGKDMFLFMPSTPGAPIAPGSDAGKIESFRNGQLRLTTAAGLARLPQATVPVPTRDGAPPFGLSVVGPRGTDEALLRLACELEKALME